MSTVGASSAKEAEEWNIHWNRMGNEIPLGLHGAVRDLTVLI